MSSKIVLLDSSVWIEILTSGPRVKACQREFDHAEVIIVPTTVIFEVYRKISASLSEDLALSAITILTQHQIKDLTKEVSLTAADYSLQYKLAMADSFILAHAQLSDATLISLNHDFSEIDGVKVIH